MEEEGHVKESRRGEKHGEDTATQCQEMITVWMSIEHRKTNTIDNCFRIDLHNAFNEMTRRAVLDVLASEPSLSHKRSKMSKWSKRWRKLKDGERMKEGRGGRGILFHRASWTLVIKPYSKVVTYSEEVVLWRIIMVECVTNFAHFTTQTKEK